MAFPILWTLDPLSLGFNFCPPPLAPARRTRARPITGPPSSRASRVRLSPRAVPPTLFVADLRIQATDARDNAARPRCGTRRCTMRQQSGAAPLSAGSPRLLTIISLSFPFASSLFLSLSLVPFLPCFFSLHSAGPIERILQWCIRDG